MGFGAVAATAILAAAVAIGGTNLLDASLDAQQRLDDAMAAANERTLARGQTVLGVSACWDTDNGALASDILYVFVANDGQAILDASLAALMVDGQVQLLNTASGDTLLVMPTRATTLSGGLSTSLWPPGSVLRFKVDTAEAFLGSNNAPTRVGVITEHGVLAFDSAVASNPNTGNNPDDNSGNSITMNRCA